MELPWDKKFDDMLIPVDFSVKGNLTKSILLLVSVKSAQITLAMVPAMVSAFLPHTRNKIYTKEINQAFETLERKKMVVRVANKDSWAYQVTPRGQQVLTQFELERYQQEKAGKWDNKWRMVIFDIPEDQAWKRRVLRSQLFRIGFVKIQNSVWVYPYPCHDLVDLIRNKLEFSDEVLYSVSELLEDDSILRKHFKLK